MSDVEYRIPEPNEPFHRWRFLDFDTLRNHLMTVLDGEDIRVIGDYLIAPFLISKSSSARTLIENRLSRSREYSDSLFLAEMLKVWQEKDASACTGKLYEAIIACKIEMAPGKHEFVRQIFGMNKTAVHSSS